MSKQILIFLLISIKTNAYTPMPEDAKALINSLPQKAVTLELVTLKAVQNSEIFNQIKAQIPTIEIPDLSAKVPLEFTMDTGLSYFQNRNEPDSPFGLTRMEASQFNLGFSKYFSTGTAVGLSMTHGRYFKTLPTGFSGVGYDDIRKSYAELTVSQNLWRDAFGFATRKNLQKGQIDSEIKKIEIDEATEDFMLNLAQIFYRAWAAQSDVRAAQSGVARRERLLNITQRKVTNGTAEKPDLLQVKSAVVATQIRLLNAKEVLDTIWRELVTTLKFPMTWSTVDPLQIPTAIDNPIDAATSLCLRSQASTIINSSTTLKKSQLQKTAATLGLEAAKNLKNPSLALVLAMGSNGVDQREDSTTLRETFAGEHPHYSAMLNLKVPFTGYQSESQLRGAFANKEVSEARFNQNRAGLETDWITTCEQLSHWQEKVSQLKQVVENQKERVALEESRFRLGRVPLLNLIQAGDDQTEAEINFNNAQVQYRMTAWKIKKISGLVKPYIEGLVTKK